MSLREIQLNPTLGRARDLFIFAAYTGLSYCDTQKFDFKTMAVECDGIYYIDGARIKTGNRFYTPIMPPAMKVLEKYNFQLPHICNQKVNVHLHDIQKFMGLSKPLTFHIGRHSFATLALSYDIPIEDVARMLGHANISTTSIYAKILKKTIERHTTNILSSLK